MSIMRADHRGHDFLLPETRRLAEANIAFFKRHRRLMRLVDTRQKWLLLQLVAVNPGADRRPTDRGVAANWICERAADLGIASRNTALAFLNQLVSYGFLRKEDCRSDRRMRLISLTESAEAALADWTATLLGIATGEDVSERGPERLARIHLEACEALLGNEKWIRAPLDIRLTQDMRGGWLVMSEILRHLRSGDLGGDWLPAPDFNIPSMTKTFGLSRSTLYRLVRLAVEAGIMAWQQEHGVATLAVNAYHVRQFARWTDRLLDAVAVADTAVQACEGAKPAPVEGGALARSIRGNVAELQLHAPAAMTDFASGR